MTSVDIAWMAGVFEGEGSIVIPSPHYKSGRRYPYIKLEMTDKDIVSRFRELTGIGGELHEASPSKLGTKNTWRWQFGNCRDVARFLCMIAPLLGERRKKKAMEAAEILYSNLHTLTKRQSL